ncbi:hypothetical protein DFH07DRAFT_918482 [Mycena maculata]|uniref:Uncharacterized protein n=1 Tax=Mycena maculata TaxID=230809 RepID=A0AAD7JAP7_9AGAR|nr:hypothetical protein DFH07DRAFT_918482 [Mycena maculata]
MLVLLLLYSISQVAFTGSIPTDPDPISPSLDARVSNSACPDAEHCRTIWNIIWSSLATIFSCTWVAVHPNIPGPVNTQEMSFWKRRQHSLQNFVSNRLLLFVIALLLPEYILALAIRQWLEAQRIARKYEDSEWTATHGFFLIMGGFHLFESPMFGPHEENGEPPQRRSLIPKPPFIYPYTDDKPIRMLTEKELFSPRNDFQFIVPTEQEIKDRGKSDWLAKSFVLVQTTWFLLQCIARGIEHLPITKLEIVTCAYAVMNVAVYFFWWDKPLNVGCPVRVLGTPVVPQQQKQQGKEFMAEWPAFIRLVVTAMLYIAGVQDYVLHSENLGKAPMFWANSQDDKTVIIADGITLLIGMFSGAIHCIAWWSLPFPSPTEGMLWRICWATMLVISSLLLACYFLPWDPDNFDRLRWFELLLQVLFCGVILLGIPLYIFGRIITLTPN